MQSQVLYYRGMERAVAGQWQDPNHSAKATSDRQLPGDRPKPRTSRPGTMWAGQVLRDINQKTGGKLFQPSEQGEDVNYHTAVFSLGFDDCQVFDNSRHSSGVLVMRCEDLPPRERASDANTMILMVIPPKKVRDARTNTVRLVKPQCYDAYYLPVMRDAQRLGPPPPPDVPSMHFEHPYVASEAESRLRGQGMMVTPNKWADKEKTKVVQGKPFKHHVVIMNMYADSPARASCQKSMAHTAVMCCPYCDLVAVPVVGRTRRRLMLGYHKPVVLDRGRLAGKGVQMVVDQERLRISSAANVRRALVYEQELKEAEHENRPPRIGPDYWGLEGLNVFSRFLWYTEFNRFFLVPVNHMFHRGVFRDWLLQRDLTQGELLALANSKSSNKTVNPNRAEQAEDVDAGNGHEPGVVRAGADGYAKECMQKEHMFTPQDKSGFSRRFAGMTLNADFNKGMRDLIHYVADFDMEELMRMLDPGLQVLMIDVVQKPEILEAFQYLRTFHMVHCTIQEWESEEQRVQKIREARDAFLCQAL